MPDKRPIGFLLIDAKHFKDTLMPNPQRCLQAVNSLMPVLAKSKMQKIIDETNDASYKPWFKHFGRLAPKRPQGRLRSSLE